MKAEEEEVHRGSSSNSKRDLHILLKRPKSQISTSKSATKKLSNNILRKWHMPKNCKFRFRKRRRKRLSKSRNKSKKT
jgi:hypothetical protein